jgi:hypothetical protein
VTDGYSMTHLKVIRVMKIDDTGQFTLLWWQWWLLAMVTINTGINMIVFFKHRFKGKEK